MEKLTDATEQRINEIKAELSVLDESDNQAREELRLATETADKLSGTKNPEKKSEEEIIDPEEIEEKATREEAEREVEKLSPGDREKIGWGLATIGFKVEEKKNILFALALEKGVARMAGEKNVLGRFAKELRDSFVRDAQNATKKAKGEGVILKQFGDKITLAGNILKYGRMVTDLTGASLASPLRYVMMGGMVTSRLAEAAKETRLKNEEVIEKTRIKDAEAAAKEAWKIYADARKREGKTEGEDVSVESFKKSYLMAMPKDLLERISRETKATDSFLQEIISFDLQLSIERLNKKINKIENNKKFTPEQKETEIQKLLTKQKKNLEDYDRIVTQYGTVDELAMAARYAQTTGKAIVAGVQIETLFLSVQRLSETVSNLFHHNHETLGTGHNLRTEKTSPDLSHSNTQISNATTNASEQGSGTSASVRDLTTPETPGAGHEITSDFSIKLGEGGVPKNLETVFSAIAANHMTLPADGTINEESAAKILNIAANLTKLTEGHGAAGITAEEWAKAGNFWKGELEIKDHATFNNILQKLQANADKNWTAGVLQSKGAASSYVANISQDSWLNKIVHAQGLEKTSEGIETGIIGHDEVEGNKVQDFDHDKIPETETVSKTSHIETSALAEGTTKTQEDLTTSELIKKMEAGDKSLPDERVEIKETEISENLSREEILRKELLEKMERGDPSLPDERVVASLEQEIHSAPDIQSFSDLTPRENAILLSHPEYLKNYYDLGGKELLKTYETSQDNLKLLFGKHDPYSIWNELKNVPAEKVMNRHIGSWSKIRAAWYLDMLSKATGLEPSNLAGKNESAESFVIRALQKLAKNNQTKVFELTLFDRLGREHY